MIDGRDYMDAKDDSELRAKIRHPRNNGRVAEAAVELVRKALDDKHGGDDFEIISLVCDLIEQTLSKKPSHRIEIDQIYRKTHDRLPHLHGGFN